MAGKRRYVWIEGANGGGWMEVGDREHDPQVHIIGDHHEPFMSMADGKMYDSKSAYRRELKARGYEEVACSLESRMQSEIEYAKPKMPEITQNELNHAAEAIGFDWERS